MTTAHGEVGRNFFKWVVWSPWRGRQVHQRAQLHATSASTWRTETVLVTALGPATGARFAKTGLLRGSTVLGRIDASEADT